MRRGVIALLNLRRCLTLQTLKVPVAGELDQLSINVSINDQELGC